MVREPFFVQISDTHLFEDPSTRLWDVAPEPMLDRALDEVSKLEGRPAFIIVTGDCSSDGSAQSYQRLRRKVEIDFDTARRLFTLVTVLHWKG